MKQKHIVCILAAIAIAINCESFLTIVRAQTPAPSVWKSIELYREGRSEFDKRHYEAALNHLIDFRDANEDVLDSSTLSPSQKAFRDKLNVTISDCQSKLNQQQPQPHASASVHSRDASKA
jgi:hypothetical protein